MSPQNGKAPPRLLVMGTVLFYLCAALAMVMANKWVLQTTETPLFFLCIQLSIAVVLFIITNALGLLAVPTEFDINIVKGLAPMIGLNVVGLSFSNYTLKYVDASFYQVARGMVLPFTVLASYFFLHSRPSSRIILACAAVTAGFFIGVFLDGTPISSVGIFFGVASSMITASHSIVIKKSLDVVRGSALHMSWYSNLVSAILLVPIIVMAGEVPEIVKLFSAETAVEPGKDSPLATFLWGSLITGVVGFLMSIASLLSIKITSPITHMVSSAVRGVAATALGAWLFHDVVTTGRATSIATILFGSVYYTWVKHLESQQSSGPSPSAKSNPYERVPLEEIENGKSPGPAHKAE